MLLFFAGFQSAVQALALGELELKSQLNQPLNVIIPLVFSAENELEELKLTVGGPEGESSGLRVWHNLKVKVVENDGSQPYLMITTKQVIREPVLRFVLDVSWSSGRIQREYSLLLDPKTIKPDSY